MHSLRFVLFCASLVSLILPAGCGKKRAPAGPAMKRVKLGYEERGIASWYGHPYHGRATASGEIYDMERLTAAHPRLPFGVTTRVVNLANGKSVEVKINDRGPFVAGRIIDLSRGAARQIDLLGPGVTRVRIKVIAAPAQVRAAAEDRHPNSHWAFLLHPARERHARQARALVAARKVLNAPTHHPHEPNLLPTN